MKGFLQTILQDFMKTNDTWNIRPLVKESFVPSTRHTSVLYCRLTDFLITCRTLAHLASPSSPNTGGALCMYLESPLLLYLFALLWNNAHVAMVLHSTYYALLASCFTPLLVFLVYLAYQTTVGTIVKCKQEKNLMSAQ